MSHCSTFTAFIPKSPTPVSRFRHRKLPYSIIQHQTRAQTKWLHETDAGVATSGISNRCSNINRRPSIYHYFYIFSTGSPLENAIKGGKRVGLLGRWNVITQNLANATKEIYSRFDGAGGRWVEKGRLSINHANDLHCSNRW